MTLAFLITGIAIAQDTPSSPPMQARVASPVAAESSTPTAPKTRPPSTNSLKVTFSKGQLSIQAMDSTLTEILAQVATLTGVRFDVPAAARNERLAVVKLGPDTPRQVLALLFDGSNLDYLIQASSTDPDKIANVILVPHTKKVRNNTAPSSVAGRFRGQSWGARASHSQADAPSAETNSPAPAQSNYGQALGAPLTSASEHQVLSNQPTEQLPTSPPAPSNRSGLTTEGAMNPPPMDRQSINMQLQKMYQQRTQMMQQTNPQITNPAPASPGNH